MLNHYKVESMPNITATKLRSPSQAHGHAHGEEKVPIYQADGDGRDSYIINKGGGFIRKNKPYRFCEHLRDYDIVRRRAFGVVKTSDYY